LRNFRYFEEKEKKPKKKKEKEAYTNGSLPPHIERNKKKNKSQQSFQQI
jgi:hypothetical protein